MFYLLFLIIFAGYNMPITQFINEYREVKNTIFLEKEANIVILLRGKLHG